MKRAIVLGGGGSRGSYQLGAWQALNELGVDYQMVLGTSIGSINAALMAQGDYALSEHLWETVTVDQVMVDGVNVYPDIESFFNQNKDLGSFLRRYAKGHGADISPLIELVSKSVDEERVRASGIEMGLVAVKFPQLTPLEVTLADIPRGRLIDYLMASAALYPAFPVYHIEGQGYIDGGYYDNMPVNLALRNGAEELVCVDIFNKPSHAGLLGRPWIRYIHPSQNLGPTLLFEQSQLQRNRLMGYLDTLREYGRVLGTNYAFEPQSVLRQQARSQRFSLALARMEDALALRSAVARLAGTRTPLSDALNKALPVHRTTTSTDDLLVGAGWAADRLGGIEPVKLYSLEDFDRLLLERLELKEAQADVDNLSAGGPRVLLEMLAGRDRKRITRLLTVVLNRKMLRGPLIRAVTLFPEELVAACYLAGLLPQAPPTP